MTQPKPSRALLPVGTVVRWSSQAHGVWKEKQGLIEAFVPAGRPIPACWSWPEGIPISRFRFGQDESSYDRYVVKVTDERGKVWFYAPLASVVRPVLASRQGGTGNDRDG